MNTHGFPLEPVTEMVELDRANPEFWIQKHHQNQG